MPPPVPSPWRACQGRFSAREGRNRHRGIERDASRAGPARTQHTDDDGPTRAAPSRQAGQTDEIRKELILLLAPRPLGLMEW